MPRILTSSRLQEKQSSHEQLFENQTQFALFASSNTWNLIKDEMEVETRRV